MLEDKQKTVETLKSDLKKQNAEFEKQKGEQLSTIKLLNDTLKSFKEESGSQKAPNSK